MRFVSFLMLGLVVTASSAVAVDSKPRSRSLSEMFSDKSRRTMPTYPNYIKCRKTEVMGSLVKRESIFRTIEQWKESAALGNEGTRDMVEGLARSGDSNGN